MSDIIRGKRIFTFIVELGPCTCMISRLPATFFFFFLIESKRKTRQGEVPQHWSFTSCHSNPHVVPGRVETWVTCIAMQAPHKVNWLLGPQNNSSWVVLGTKSLVESLKITTFYYLSSYVSKIILQWFIILMKKNSRLIKGLGVQFSGIKLWVQSPAPTKGWKKDKIHSTKNLAR